MKNDKKYYFLLGFMTAMLVAMFIVVNLTPLEARSKDCGENNWNPCYVKIVK